MSLYSGAGGLDIGFMEAGLVPSFAIDVDPTAAATYSFSYKRLRDSLPHLEGHDHQCQVGDIARSIDDLDSVTADLVIGGPPCQGFSVAGKMDPTDPRSRLVWRFLDAVERVRPEAFVMENVKALAANSRWAGLLDGLREKASQLGYSTSVLLLNASHYGVPQARERMFLVGLQGNGTLAVPLETSKDGPPTVGDALQELPPYGLPGNDSKCKAIVTPARRPILRRSPFAGMLFNGAGRPMQINKPAPTLPASMGGNRTPIIDQNHWDGNGDCWITEYHAHLMGGGEPYQAAPGFLRRITVEEAARIQGFSSDMEWRGRQSAVYRQIGNAVPPPLAAAVAQAVADRLAE